MKTKSTMSLVALLVGLLGSSAFAGPGPQPEPERPKTSDYKQVVTPAKMKSASSSQKVLAIVTGPRGNSYGFRRL